MHIKVHKCSAALFTAETKETLKAPPAGREWIWVSFSSSTVSFHADIFMYTVVSQNWSQTILFLLQISKLYNLI